MQLRSTRLTAIASAAKRLFNIKDLFAAGEQGAWYDPSDLTTLFQDSAGTTPVTAIEQPVGLMLDKSKGLVLGPELVTNGAFDTDTAWNKGDGWAISGRVAAKTAGTASFLAQPATITAGNHYLITYTVTVTSGTITPQFSGGVTVSATVRNSGGTYSEYMIATSGTNTIRFLGNSAFSGTLDNVSVRELPGNHAFQSTAASRPVLSARYNLLTKTEQFDDAAWTKTGSTVTPNAVTAPDGTLTADKLAEDSANTVHRVSIQPLSTVVGGTYTFSVHAKKAERDWLILRDVSRGLSAWVNLSTGVAGTVQAGLSLSVSDVGNGWYRCTLVRTAEDNNVSWGIHSATANGVVTYQGDGTSGIYIWGADLRVTNDGAGLPAYQRVNTATDYDTTGFPLYLRCDGVDDGMVTNSIDFSATDKMTVVAGVRKLSDGARGMFVELGANQTNSFNIEAPNIVLNNYHFISRGTTFRDATSAQTYISPITNTLTGLGDISGDSVILHLNGTQAATNAGDQGTGNYGNYPLFLFRRGGTTLPFNGRFYGLVVRGAQSSAAQIAALEQWMNGKTKAY